MGAYMIRYDREIDLIKFFKRSLELANVPHSYTSITPRGSRGFPDGVLLLPNGVTIFIEFKKSQAEELSPNQTHFIARMFSLGHTPALLLSKSDVVDFFRERIRPMSGREVHGCWEAYKWSMDPEDLTWKPGN